MKSRTIYKKKINEYSNIHNGKAILIKLANNMNSKRYFSTILDIIDIEELNELFKLEPPFNKFSKKKAILLWLKILPLQKAAEMFKLNIFTQMEMKYPDHHIIVKDKVEKLLVYLLYQLKITI